MMLHDKFQQQEILTEQSRKQPIV
uniref:Uncharacterized protein n=1 Tax=Anguilla anguilla TaxID=7936 RepID=A0A0E9UDR8_ANGAN